VDSPFEAPPVEPYSPQPARFAPGPLGQDPFGALPPPGLMAFEQGPPSLLPVDPRSLAGHPQQAGFGERAAPGGRGPPRGGGGPPRAVALDGGRGGAAQERRRGGRKQGGRGAPSPGRKAGGPRPQQERAGWARAAGQGM
jgi:hypothetical protein